ncbi:type I-E CRISPR-associated protein Cas5/CasD [Streptomyces qinzhouensis]|uniref:Type I-E CRISPR-associated protein Cas5/CasD n=1 Tax=Streptomyces qinzhouensis TaxID=2599401 RepID=A0A5B8JEZ7_9ACTN|nr:type I-E CRISPR-associated protein Cas5/CasD [Streptomyces qinzhouensis]QDY80355.1 type I-E CRISPR-associated protein Cas5/CasD [Streptomyces qinzhouensis]
MSGLLLRLAGPLQSWGERSAFTTIRDTASFPTRSGLIGMLAAAEGISRNQGGLERYDGLRFTIRTDRPGHRLVDFHTVGGGQPKARTAATSGGSNKGAAVITRRHYLSDAVFVVAVTTPDEKTATRLAEALDRPHWAPYLGRRSCVPDEPLVLRCHAPDPEEELLTRVPLARTTPPHHGEDTVGVEFLYESPPEDPAQAADTIDVTDIPLSFAQHARAHGVRRLHRVTRQLPLGLTGPQSELQDRLIEYARTEESA